MLVQVRILDVLKPGTAWAHVTMYSWRFLVLVSGRGSPACSVELYDYDYDYIMAPQRGRPYGANLGSMGRNTGTWSIRSECLSNITSRSRRKGIENTTLPFIPE